MPSFRLFSRYPALSGVPHHPTGPIRTFGRVLAMAAAAVAAATALGSSGGIESVEAAPALQGCPGNRLVNPGFEGGSRKTQSQGTSLSSAVGDGWNPWFVRGDERFNREPEFKLEQVAAGGDANRVRSGWSSMKWFTTWATHTAGIYQRVAVPAGSVVNFSMYGLIYSGEADGWNGDVGTFLSDHGQPGGYRIALGIDPTGAVPANAGAPLPGSIVWSQPYMAVDTWVPVSVSAPARGPAVTVYAKGWPEWSVKHNNSWWDDGCLVVSGAAPAPIETTDQDLDIAAAPEGESVAAPVVAAPEPAVRAVRPSLTRVPGSRHYAVPR